MIEWHLEKRCLADLKEHPRNPRQLSKKDHEHLSLSLEKFGLIDKPIINQDNMIIGGHQRVKVLLAAGIQEADCHVPDRLLSDDEVDELCIRLNKNTGSWDFDVMANSWEMEDLVEWGFEIGEFGISDDDVELDEEGSDGQDKKIVILECPECKAHFEKDHAKVIDKGD
jgi:ParB-like chromosome segregation protein Spo0J